MTIHTLARELGVARSTVSNAYNRPDQLSPELRERILSKAQELGYAGPDPTARRLSVRQATTIGVLFSESITYPFSDSAALRFMEGLGLEAERDQLALLMLPAPVMGPTARNALEHAVLDALVVYSMPDGDPVLEAGLARKLPTVIVDQPFDTDRSYVGIDDYAGAKRAAEFLLEAGHTRIGIVTFRLGRETHNGTASANRQKGAIYHVARRRLAGYSDAIEAAGLDMSTVRVEERVNNTRQDGYLAARRLLGGARRPTGIIAMTDTLALGVFEAARELGLRVPEDLSIVGYDDIPESSPLGLTTIHQPLIDKGMAVGRAIKELLARPAMVGHRTTLPVEERARDSVATV